MTVEAMVPSFDGVKLYFKGEVPDGAKAIVVVVHGLCEHQGRYDYLASKLHAAGYGTYRFDHRGHGLSEGKRIFYDNKDEIVDDVNVIVDKAHDENPGKPIFLLGHSMGGYAVALYGTKYPGKVDGIVSSGALTFNNGELGSDIPEGTPVDAKLPNALGSIISHDQEIVQAYADDPLVEKEICAGLFYTIADGVAWLKDNLSNFTDPVLMLHGAADGIVAEKDSRDFFGAVSSDDKELIIYAKLFHEIMNEPEKDRVISDIIYWLDAR